MTTAQAESPDRIAERLDEFERTKNPAALWPRVSEHARVAAARELARVTQEIIRGRNRATLDAESRHTAYALGIAGHTTGMGPVIGRWIEDGRLGAAPEVSRVFTDHLRHARKRAVRMEREVLPAIDALLAESIVLVVLKGFHTGRAYFAEAGARCMADVDLLVPVDRVSDAETALHAAGFIPESVALRPYKRDWIAADIDARIHSIELSHEQSKWSLELHASLNRVYHPGATARVDALRSQVVPLEIAGRPLLALSPSALLVYLACHCSQELDGIRLLRLYELSRIIRCERTGAAFSWDAVLDTLTRTQSARFAYPALALVDELDPGLVDDRVLALGRRQSTWAARHTVPRLTPAGGSLDERGVIRQLMWTRGLVSVGTRLLRNVWPASFQRPRDVVPGWRVRLRRFANGALFLQAPNERQ
ncbi:MAG TPA: nucleotidyltransferase family protein [Gemmatimonadaceae bacterium]